MDDELAVMQRAGRWITYPLPADVRLSSVDAEAGVRAILADAQ